MNPVKFSARYRYVANSNDQLKQYAPTLDMIAKKIQLDGKPRIIVPRGLIDNFNGRNDIYDYAEFSSAGSEAVILTKQDATDYDQAIKAHDYVKDQMGIDLSTVFIDSYLKPNPFEQVIRLPDIRR